MTMEPQAFNRLVQAHRDRIYGHALYVLRDPDDAQDATQEAFLRLWRQGADLPPDRVKPWLLRVVHNLCLDQKRRQGARRRHFGRPDAEAVDALRAGDDSWQRPDAGIRQEILQQEVLAALATLTPETRSLVMMHYYQGLKIKDIADLLDKNLNSVKVQIHRARRALRLVLTSPRADLAEQREIC